MRRCGSVVTADGSFTDIPRENYDKGEEETVKELRKIGKPFVVLLNSVKPYSDETVRLAEELKEKYGVSVFPVNCEQLRKEDVNTILKGILYEFPIVRMDFFLPNGWRCWRGAIGSRRMSLPTRNGCYRISLIRRI